MSAIGSRQSFEGGDGLTPGAQLAQAREALQFSTEEVARQLKLSVWQVEALERGEYERLPGVVFVRGFIRNYARLVRLDPEALLRQLDGCISPAPAQPDRPRTLETPFPGEEPRRTPVRAVFALLLVAGLAAYEFYWNTEPAERMERAVPASASQSAGPVTASAVQPPAPAPVAPRPGEAAAMPAAAAVATGTPAATAPVDQPALPGGKRVRLEFEEDSWVEIRDSEERVIFSRLNPAGTEQVVEGRPPLSLVVGNAHAVRLTYDGKPVDLAPHTRVDVARLTLQ